MSVLVIAEHDNAALAAATLNAVAAACQLDDDVHVLVAGAGCAAAADAAARGPAGSGRCASRTTRPTPISSRRISPP